MQILNIAAHNTDIIPRWRWCCCDESNVGTRTKRDDDDVHDDDFNDNDAGDHEYDDYDEVMVIWMISAMMMVMMMMVKMMMCMKRMLISGWVQGCQEGGLCLTITRPRRVLVSIKHAPWLFTCEWISNTNLYISFIFYSNHVVKISKWSWEVSL